MEHFKISVITVCFNSSSVIRDCINSVLNQSFKEIEYIIIDANSGDETVNIIKSYGEKISITISEPDKGFYDAMNKGIAISSGEIISILNSDDIFYNENILEKVADLFEISGADCVYGDLFYVRRNNLEQIVRHWITGEYRPGGFSKGWHPAHPAFFLKREIYEKFGAFNLSYHLAADFELMIRMLEKNRISSVYLPLPLVKMRLGGATNKNLENIFRQNIECIRAFKQNGLRPGLFYIIWRLLKKFRQYIQ
jgi:glycosyltransferase involved in cell wall biosynthesis